MPLPRNSTAIGRFLAQQFQRTDETLYRVNYENFWSLDNNQNFITVIPDLPLTLESFKAFSMTEYGSMPALLNGRGLAFDFPVVDVALGELPEVPCAMFGLAMMWSQFDLDRMQNAIASNVTPPNFNVIQTKQEAVNLFFNLHEHETNLYGYQAGGKKLTGLFTQPDTRTLESGFIPYNGSMSSQQLYDDMIDLIYTFSERARLSNFSQITMMITNQLARELERDYIFNSNSTGRSVMQKIQESRVGSGVTIVVRNELKGSNLNTKIKLDDGSDYPADNDRIMFYGTTANLRKHVYARDYAAPFQIDTYNWEVKVVSAQSSIMNYEDPQAIWYVDYPNTTTP